MTENCFRRRMGSSSHASTEFLAATPRIKVLIAGRPSERLGFFRAIPTLLDSLQQWPNLAVGVVLDRAGLTRDERRLLMQWERRRAEAASRVLLIPEAFHLDALRTERWDVGVLAGLPIHAYQRWQELLPIPLIGSEAQVKLLPQSEADPRVMARVSEVAWLEQSLALSQKSELREQTRIAMQVNAHRFFKDDATNRISRMYAVALADGVSAS